MSDIFVPLDEEDLVRATEMIMDGITPQEAAIQIFLDRLATVDGITRSRHDLVVPAVVRFRRFRQ